MATDDEAPPIVEARDLRVGDVLFNFDDDSIRVERAINFYGKIVLVTWRSGSRTWDNTYSAQQQVQLFRRETPDVP
jgi:hypothetical protein